jgi:hypothetical protein
MRNQTKSTESRRERTRATPAPPDAATQPNGAADAGAPTPEMVNNEMKRLLHRVAWTRMFGHAERRNPYEK